MDRNKSKVYVLLDGEKIVRCEGGYTSGNISDLTRWVYIDEGTGDRYNLCQTHYFSGGLRTDDGLCRWKYVNGKCVPRTYAEIAADRAAAAAAEEQSTEDVLLDTAADHEYRLCLLELGIEQEDE